MREWMEKRLPPRLLGVIDWPRYRLASRCWAEGCGRAMLLHSPSQERRCAATPMAIVLNEARYAELTGEQVVPVSMHADSA